jgi:hypothetical protein
VEAGLIPCPHPAWGNDRFVSRLKSSITFSPVSFVRVGAPGGGEGGEGGGERRGGGEWPPMPQDRTPSADRQWASRAATLSGAWTRGWRLKGSSANEFQDRALPNVFGLTENDYADAAGGRAHDWERRQGGRAGKGAAQEKIKEGKEASEVLPSVTSSTRKYDVREALDTDIYTCDNVIDAYDVTESYLAGNAQQGAWSVGVYYMLFRFFEMCKLITTLYHVYKCSVDKQLTLFVLCMFL